MRKAPASHLVRAYGGTLNKVEESKSRFDYSVTMEKDEFKKFKKSPNASRYEVRFGGQYAVVHTVKGRAN